MHGNYWPGESPRVGKEKRKDGADDRTVGRSRRVGNYGGTDGEETRAATAVSRHNHKSLSRVSSRGYMNHTRADVAERKRARPDAERYDDARAREALIGSDYRVNSRILRIFYLKTDPRARNIKRRYQIF